MRQSLFVSAATALGALGLASCLATEQSAVFIEGALLVEPPDCTVQSTSNTFVSGALLDVSIANQAVIAVKVRSNLPAAQNSQTIQQDRQRSPNLPNYGQTDTNLINFTTAKVFFTTDADREDKKALRGKNTPTNESSARFTGLGGSVFNDQTQLLQPNVVFVTIVTEADVAALLEEQFISEQLQGDPAQRARVIANLRLIGQTSGDSEIVSLPFSFPVDLCQGCLAAVPVCGPNVEPILNDVCFLGQDLPMFVCPQA